MKDITVSINGKSGRLIAKNLIILLVLIVVCMLFIWAWFTNSQTAEANGINIQSSADGVQVSWDGENWYNDLTALSEAEVQEGLIGLAKNISGRDGVSETLNLITGNGLKFFEPLLNRKTGEVLVNSDGAWQGYDLLPENSTGKYIDIDLYFRSELPKDIYLAGDSYVSPKDITQRFSEYGPFSKDYIAAASRVAFLNADKTDCSFIWAPNADVELVESDAVYTKFDTYENNNYPVPANSSCVLVNPYYGYALSSGTNYKKTVNFTDGEKDKILPISVTMAEQFITELVDDGSSGADDSSEVEQPEESVINLWTGSVGLGDWSGYTRLDSSTMSAVQVGDFIRVTVQDARDGAQVTIQNSNWSDISNFGYPQVSASQTTADFEITSDVLSTVHNGVIVKGKWATLVSVDIIRNKNAGGDTSGSLTGTAVANTATLEIENATSKTSISENPNGTLTSLASGGKYYYVGSNGYAYVPFYVEETGYYTLDVITASNSSAKDLRVLVNIDTSKGGAFVNEIISSPQTSNGRWETVSVTDSMLLQGNTQYYVAAVTDDSTGSYISVDAFEIAWQSSIDGGPSRTVIWEGSQSLSWSNEVTCTATSIPHAITGDQVTIEYTANGDAQVQLIAYIGDDMEYTIIPTSAKMDHFSLPSTGSYTFTLTSEQASLFANARRLSFKGQNGTIKSIYHTKAVETETFSSSTYKFKNAKINRYLDISNGTVSYNTTGSDFKLCYIEGHDGPVLKSGDYYLVIQQDTIKAVKESEFNLNEAVTVFTGGSYSIITGLLTDTQAYTYYDSAVGSLVTLGPSSTPKLFTSTSLDSEAMLIGNTKIVTLTKENETDKYYTAHIVMRIWAEGTDREAKTPLADGIFDLSLHFVSQ